MDVSQNSGFSPQIIHFNRVFHDFHHPFWGFSPYFWFNAHMKPRVHHRKKNFHLPTGTRVHGSTVPAAVPGLLGCASSTLVAARGPRFFGGRLAGCPKGWWAWWVMTLLGGSSSLTKWFKKTWLVNPLSRVSLVINGVILQVIYTINKL